MNRTLLTAAVVAAAMTVCLCLVPAGGVPNLGKVKEMAQQATGAPQSSPAQTPKPDASPKTASPYAKGGNPLSDPNFVPILVNVQSALNAKIYAEAGVNVYDSVDDITLEPNQPHQFKPTAETLKMLSDAGILLIADQDVWKGQMASPTIIGWLSPVDEPDNVQDAGKPMPLDKYLAQSNRIKETDPTRPYFVCFGQGVANEAFRGRGAKCEDYPKYMDVVDFIQYDVYPITNIRKKDGENYLQMVGQGISKIRAWTQNKKPSLCWIETTHIKDPNKCPTPAQTACEVWITMVHGARGVGYFCHDFTIAAKRASALSRDKDMLAQLKVTNAKLKKLALVISAPLASEPKVATGEGGKVIFSTKTVGADDYVIAVNVLGEKAKATIPVGGFGKSQNVEVLEENRQVRVDTDHPAIADEFAPYQEHVYRWTMGR